jgi:hypothetical protein
MAEPTHTYRIWQNGMGWHWQLIANQNGVIAAGVAPTSTKARSAAFEACLERQHDRLKET